MRASIEATAAWRAAMEVQQRPRYWPLCVAALVIGFVCGDAVLRSLFSEERAKQVESVRWCGAAKQLIAERESKGGFLFQICITRDSRRPLAPDLFVRPKCLIGLDSQAAAGGLPRHAATVRGTGYGCFEAPSGMCRK
jgi:hypothetical protein